MLVDNRGTGGSGILICKRLQSYTGRTSGPAFAKLVGACGDSLNHGFKLRDGHWLHASDLYGTAYAVADLAAILRRLDAGRVTIYGDSYGSWFTQAFIARHPAMIGAVILDSTYYLRGLSPWYASSGIEGRRAMLRVCERNIACNAHGGAQAVARFAALLAQVRQQPISGATRLAGGARVHQTVGPRQLADLVQDSGSDPVILRESDASVRAALAGDDVPLLRLVAQEQAYNHGTSSAVYFNDALYMAVSCTDYPQLFDMHASPSVRARQFARAVAQQSSAPFAPFSTAEWVTQSGYSQPYDVCLDWPSPIHRAPVEPAKPTVLPASIPILAIGGDVDDLTPLSDVRTFAPTLGRNVRVVDLHNTVHATSEGDTFLSVGSDCARSIIDRFAKAPSKLQTMGVSCAAKIPPIHTPGNTPKRSHRRRGRRSSPGTIPAAPRAARRGSRHRRPPTRRSVTTTSTSTARACAVAASRSNRSSRAPTGSHWTETGSSAMPPPTGHSPGTRRTARSAGRSSSTRPGGATASGSPGRSARRTRARPSAARSSSSPRRARERLWPSC